MKVIDLFAGMGGLSLGFRKCGFRVRGFDINPAAVETFRKNGIGKAEVADLRKTEISDAADIVVGGPPCRPWSCVNLNRRGEKHPDYDLLDTFFLHVRNIEPDIFLMENVIPLKKDAKFREWIKSLDKSGYRISISSVCYADFGAPTARKRLIVFGSYDGCTDFFTELNREKKRPKTVWQVIRRFAPFKRKEYPDHEWPRLRTIEKYLHYYETGKYGWYRLKPDRPAPSFGNIMKTYILHPYAGMDGIPLRVISVREAMAIMGFGSLFRFPDNVGMSAKYQMVADTVSPVFSGVCAKTIRKILKK